MPFADAYDGPVLFEGAAAAEVFNEMIAGKVVGMRRPVTSATSPMVAGGKRLGGSDWLLGAATLDERGGRPFTPRDGRTPGGDLKSWMRTA